MKFILKTIATTEQRRILFGLAKNAGIKAFIGWKRAKGSGDFYPIKSIGNALDEFHNWDYLIFDDEKGTIDATNNSLFFSCNDDYKLVTFNNFITILANHRDATKCFKMQLSSRCTATINIPNDEVTIEGQTFPLQSIRELITKVDIIKGKE